jgi:hypothetical protein
VTHTYGKVNTTDPYEEIIAIQADIALQIADHIRVFISDPEKQRIQKIPTANQQAYELVQEALYLFNTDTFSRGRIRSWTTGSTGH